jgi:hypothetical protein
VAHLFVNPITSHCFTQTLCNAFKTQLVQPSAISEVPMYVCKKIVEANIFGANPRKITPPNQDEAALVTELLWNAAKHSDRLHVLSL